MNIWIFQTGEPMHGDSGSPRPMRAMNLANALVDRGHKVVIWTSSFYHQEKRHRHNKFHKKVISNNLSICFIPSPGYVRNVGLGRLYDHALLAINLYKQLRRREMSLPDIAFIGYPPIEFSYLASRWLKHKGIPFIVDVKDQWPDIFIRAFPTFLSPIVRIIFFPYFYMGKKVIRESTVLCSMTHAFSNWAKEFSQRSTKSVDLILPLAPVFNSSSSLSGNDVRSWLSANGISVDENIFRIFFVGNFMATAFNFNPLIEAAQLAQLKGLNWQFVLCGDGEKWESIKQRCSALPNVFFPGRVNRNQILALSKISNVGVAPILNTPDYLLSVPNKVVDYFSLGLPVVTSLGGEVEGLIREWSAGIKYIDSVKDSLFEVLCHYYKNPDLVSLHSKNSRLLYESDFDGEKIYKNAVYLIEKMVKS